MIDLKIYVNRPEKKSIEQESGCIILVPNGESLGLFIQFFRKKGGAAEEARLQVWIANMEEGDNRSLERKAHRF